VHARYTVNAAPAPTPTVTPTPTPVVVPSKAPAALRITRSRAKRIGRTVTLTLRGTAAGTGAIEVTALKRTVRAKLVRGVWKATLKLRTTAQKVKLSVTDAGDATHRTGSATKTVSVR
jgi:hypothetical protein